MFNLSAAVGELGDFQLGTATVVIDDIYGHRETPVGVVGTRPAVIRALLKVFARFVRKLGAFFGAVAFAAWLNSLNPGTDLTPHLPAIMGAITSAVSSSFKVNLGLALHDFTITTGHVVKTALYTSSATLGASTTAYSGTNEVANGSGYTTTGVTIANVTPVLSSTTAIYDWADASWTSSSFTANGCLVYDSTNAGKQSLFSIAFGSDQTVTSGTFTIVWPTADASNAIIRIA